MNIKESCRLQNHIDLLINMLSYYLKDTNNATKTTEKHLKSKSNPDAKDEIKEVVIEKDFGNDCSVVDIAYLVEQLLIEKLNLTNAIFNSKGDIAIQLNNIIFTLDSAVENAKKSRDLAYSLKPLVDLKGRETKTTAKDYKFNNEGNQVPYIYDLEIVRTLDFDRNDIIKLYKKLLDRADTLSTLIESEMLTDRVKFEPKYDIHDSVNDVVEKYLINRTRV